MACATIPKSSNSFCNVTASHIKPAGQTIQDLMDLLREWFGVAKKLMDKAGKEGKPWISGLFDYRVTPQSGSIASPLQLLTQCTPGEKNLPQLPSALGAREMHQTHQELIKRQRNKPERNYTELAPGTPIWVQHRQNATRVQATVVNQCAPNSLDHAVEWCRATKSVQAHQNNVENKIYSHRRRTNSPNERVDNRNKKHQV